MTDLILTLRVWATSPWLDPRVRHGRRAGRMSYAFPLVLALAFAALWIGGGDPMITRTQRVHPVNDECGGYGCGCYGDTPAATPITERGHQPPAVPGGFDLESECTGAYHPHCVAMLARRFIPLYDCCPACTRLAVDAIDAVLPDLTWHPLFAEAGR